MKNSKLLVAYIAYENELPFIDVVEISKKGMSYWYDEQRWHRVFPVQFTACENDAGQKLRITPLNRNYDRYSDISDQIIVKERAIDRYNKWKNGELSSLSIKSVQHKKLHILVIEFSDGHIEYVDFAPFIFSNKHPDYVQYHEESNFLTYQIVDGNLNWDDYTMIFPINDLRNNKLL